MPDSFTEITHQGWFSRIGKSFMGVLFGIALTIGSVILLFWNEKRAVQTERSLKEGASAVVAIESASIQPGNEGKLVHLSGELVPTGAPVDPLFGVTVPALRLSRKVEMYQWKEEEKSETRNKLGGGTETVTTYEYRRNWSASPIDSRSFKHPEGHTNPDQWLAKSTVTLAPKITLGAFLVPESISRQLHGDEPHPVGEAELRSVSAALKPRLKLAAAGFYAGADPGQPAVGDQRITFSLLRPGPFSILAQQRGNTLAGYQTRAGDTIERVESGTVSAAEMFQHAQAESTRLTWILRGVGFILMSVGIALTMGPLQVLSDVIPFIGNIIGAGIGMASLILGAVGSLITIAVAWFAVRPLLSMGLAAVVALLIFAGVSLGRKRQA